MDEGIAMGGAAIRMAGAGGRGEARTRGQGSPDTMYTLVGGDGEVQRPDNRSTNGGTANLENLGIHMATRRSDNVGDGTHGI